MRPLIPYYGGKGNMVRKLLPLVPPKGEPYCEPFCGGASLFFARDPAPVEVLNDLNKNVITLFRVIQDKGKSAELIDRLRWTPYARAEFERALSILADTQAHDDVTHAWATFVAHNQGMSGQPVQTPGQWSHNITTSVRGMAQTTSKWISRLGMLEWFRDRLMRVQIECRDAIDVIRMYDNPNAVFYIDPPYVQSTRKTRSIYTTECGDGFHASLVETLLQCQGACVVSGYNSAIYEPLTAAGWEKIEFQTACYAAGRVRTSNLIGKGAALANVPRTEVVWRNQAAVRSTSPLIDRGGCT